MTSAISSGSFDDVRRPASFRSIICRANARTGHGRGILPLPSSESHGWTVRLRTRGSHSGIVMRRLRNVGPCRLRSPSGLNGQAGGCAAMRRRVLSRSRAMVSPCMSVRMSWPASCSIRSSRCTSSPWIHNEAQASAKCIRSRRPSPTGERVIRSSRRASATPSGISPAGSPGWATFRYN